MTSGRPNQRTEAIWFQPDPPCDTCHYKGRCRTFWLACDDFYVHTLGLKDIDSVRGAVKRRKAPFGRFPTREIFQKIFG